MQPAGTRFNPSNNYNNLIQALLTDKYQVSMCFAYWTDSRHEEPAVFDLFFRKNPFKGEFTIFAGLDECLKYIENFRFSIDDIQYLKTIPDYKHIDQKFWIYLNNLDIKRIKLSALTEGSVCFPSLPLVRVEGPLGILQLIETTLLNLVNYASLVATNAARYKLAIATGPNPNCRLLEFGLRRAQGPDGGFSASRYSFIGGFDATSNLMAGKAFGIPVSGTLGHAFIMSYYGTTRATLDGSLVNHKFMWHKYSEKLEDFTVECLQVERELFANSELTRKCQADQVNKSEFSELQAFINFAYAFPDTFLALVDTYDVIRSGLINFCLVAIALFRFGYKPIGIRIDSGDLAYLSRFARDLFSAVADEFQLEDFRSLEIVASNDINEETITSLNDQNHAITSMGIGTHLVTCQSQPALGCVYKLVEASGTPCMKLSSVPEKITIPCKKSTFRLYGRDGHALLDLIIMSDEPEPQPNQRILCRHPFIGEKRCYATPARVERLLIPWWDGKLIKQPPGLLETREYCLKSLGQLTDDIKRSLNPTPYKVSVSEKLFTMLNELLVKLTPIGELS